MKFTVETNEFAAALLKAKRIINRDATLPILAFALLEASGDSLKLTATDLDTTITVTIPAHVETSGAIALPARVLAKYVRQLQSHTVTLETAVTLESETPKVSVTSAKSVFVIRAMLAEDFLPTTPLKLENAHEITLAQSELKQLLHMTTFAASREESRSVLTGVLFRVRNDILTLAASDMHRLAKCVLPLLKGAVTAFDAIIPATSLHQVKRLLKAAGDENAVITISEKIEGAYGIVRFEIGAVVVTARVLDAVFPDCEKVIPKSCSGAITINRSQLIAALSRAKIVANGSCDKVIFEASADSIALTAQAWDMGDLREELWCETNGAPPRIAFNGAYFLEVLKLMDGENIVIELNGALNPGTLRSSEDDSFLCVLMPMSI